MFSHGKKCYDPTRITCECFHKIFLLRNATDLTMVDLTKYLPTDLWKFWAIEPSFSRNICHQKSSVVVQSPVFTKYFAKERPVKGRWKSSMFSRKKIQCLEVQRGRSLRFTKKWSRRHSVIETKIYCHLPIFSVKMICKNLQFLPFLDAIFWYIQ